MPRPPPGMNSRAMLEGLEMLRCGYLLGGSIRPVCFCTSHAKHVFAILKHVLSPPATCNKKSRVHLG